jgi:hypothetical protein
MQEALIFGVAKAPFSNLLVGAAYGTTRPAAPRRYLSGIG